MLRAERDAGDSRRFESRSVCGKATLLAEQQLTSAACERGQQSAPEREQRPRATQCQTSLRRGNCIANRVPTITNIEATVEAPPTPRVHPQRRWWASGRRCPGLVSCISEVQSAVRTTTLILILSPDICECALGKCT